ncbi:MAG: heme lyase CcmF/NrfE family subunit [Acidobacteria bacterium]|nr:heme lyase CcmF/NrfE family subunit [Acidobacteriota bacterium]
MNGQLGYFFVVVGFATSVVAAATLSLAILTGRRRVLKQALPYASVLAISAIGAFVVMERALITRDFEVAYVARVGSHATPALYNFTSIWSSLEGSILLWGLILAGYIMVVAMRFRSRLTDELVGWAMVTLFVVAGFFFLLMVGPANPFETFNPPPGFDGPGPNPLLQNHILVAVHPPILYLGYVGFTVPFAFAIAALATGRLGEGWFVETRRWTLFAWGFLTTGILLGAWWSYEVLGWGGYWAWDPVENASFLPWLTGTAYLHSVMVQERRGMLRVWNLSLICATFSLTILGTFLTRSGVIESVHSFSESSIGPWLLAFFALVVTVTVVLIGTRGALLASPGQIDTPISREGAFLVNNLLFAAFAFVVLLGTVFPLIVEAVNDDRISVGGPYFDRMTMPIGMLLLFMMGVAPVLPWRKASAETLSKRLFWPAWCGVGAMLFSLMVGARGVAPVLAFGLGGFAAGSAARQVILATRRSGWRGFVGRTNGGMIVHLGVVIIAVAFAASSSFVRQGEFQLDVGETATLAGHTVTYLGLEEIEHAERLEIRALVEVDNKGVRTPAISLYPSGSQSIGTPSVSTSLVDDVHLSLVTLPEDGTPPVIRVTVQPLIVWLWIGGGVMAFGTVLAAFPGRRRRGTDPVSSPAALEEVDV